MQIDLFEILISEYKRVSYVISDFKVLTARLHRFLKG